MFLFQLFQIISSVFTNINTTIKNTLKKVNNNIPDSIRFKIIKTHSFINKKLNKHNENILKVKDNLIYKKNNIYNNFSNKKRKFNDYFDDKLYSYLKQKKYHKIS
tara:strand:+ start:4912 stop:5226 length:315 start_codon:yes stop_codon:yes gene_type:complete